MRNCGIPPAATRRRARVLPGQRHPDAVVCIGVPFGHTRPQWILPYGGRIQLDGEAKTVTASYA